MINRTLVIIGILFFCLSCASSKQKATPEQIQVLTDLVENQSMEFVADWAFPLATNSLNQLSNAGLLQPGSTAGRINLIGNVNYLKIKNDSISAYLPYFGERQFGGAYNNDNTGIRFNSVPDNLTITKDEKSNGYSIAFDITRDTESFQVFLRLFPNKKGALNINSNQRHSIAYQGTIKSLE